MAQVQLGDLTQYLAEYGWACAEMSPHMLATGFSTEALSYDLDIYLVDDWVILQIPGVAGPFDAGEQAAVCVSLLARNAEMLGVKYSLEQDGAVSLSIDLVREELSFAEFAEALDLLVGYAEAYEPSLAGTQVAASTEAEAEPPAGQRTEDVCEMGELQRLLQAQGIEAGAEGAGLAASLVIADVSYDLRLSPAGTWLLLRATASGSAEGRVDQEDAPFVLSCNADLRWAKFCLLQDGRMALALDLPGTAPLQARLDAALRLLRVYLAIYPFGPQAAVPQPEPQIPDLAGRQWKLALERLEWHVAQASKQWKYDHREGGKLPRSHDWRPYRYCIQDVLFGATVVRHDREANCLEADVFLTAEVPEYGPLAGALALTSFLLSEAYKCGGTMEIRFTNNVEGGSVPAELRALAGQHGVQVGQGAKRTISAQEAKALYAALTGFSPELEGRISSLEKAGKVRLARACYVVHHGVWTKEQVEMIVLGSEHPDSILGGMAQPQQRHLYLHDLLHARAAVMAGMLDRVLAKRERSEGGVDYELEDDVLPLRIGFDGETYTRGYRCSEAVLVRWLHQVEEAHLVPEDVPFLVLVRARDAADMRLHLAADIHLAGEMRARENQPTFVLVPADFSSLDPGVLEPLVEKARTTQVGLLVCPESVLTLDSDAAQRLAQSRILRQ